MAAAFSVFALAFQASVYGASAGKLKLADESRRPLDLRQIEECKEVNHKASLMLSNDMTLRMGMGMEITDIEKELLTRLAVGSFSEETLTDLEDLMANVTLSSAIQKGLFWTLEDQQEFARCNADKEVVRLEENLETASGHILVQGDMVALETEGASLLEGGASGAPWRDGAILYCFESGMSERAQAAFQQAVKHVTDQIPCINFTQVQTSANADQGCAAHPSVMVTSSEQGCWSFVGQINHLGSKVSQQLNLGTGCEIMGMAAHQLGHTLGLVHQTSRADRDRFLSILEWNVASTEESSYAVNFANNDDAYQNTVFDVMSLMNLSPFAFSSNGRPTILVKHDSRLTELMGQRMGFSQLDIERLAEMYECFRYATPKTQNKKLAQAFLEGKGYDDGMCLDEKYTGMSLQGTVANCTQLADAGLCAEPQHAASIQSMCPVSCMVCMPGLVKMSKPPKTTVKGANAKTSVLLDEDEDEDEPEHLDEFEISPQAPLEVTSGATGGGLVAVNAVDNNDTWHGGKHNRSEDEWLLPWKNDSAKGAGAGKGVAAAPTPSAKGAEKGAGKGKGDGVKDETEILANVSICADGEQTGIKIKDGSGEYATCAKLRHYCNHAKIGERVTQICKKTCGQCEIMSAVSANCKDKGPLEEPMYELSGVYAKCSDMQMFCSDKKIAEKCKATCGKCEVQLDMSEVVSPTPAPTSALYPKIPVNASELAHETGCSRRRSFGYCYTRRRRAE